LRQRHRGASGVKPAIVVAVLLVIAGVWWGVRSLMSSRHVEVPAIAAPTAQDSDAEPAAAPAPDGASVQSGAAVERQPPAPVDQVAAVTPPPAAASQDNVTMRLESTAPSWSEIYDASGKRLMFDVGQPGQVRTISGVAPLKVILGVAAAATVAVNDRSVAVPRLPGKDATRFVVAADGSVR
jgi:cytoskeleton protein RodZ